MSVWEIEYTDQFETWWNGLTIGQQIALGDRVNALAETGPRLRRPIVGNIVTSRHANMKELRAQADDAVMRVLFAFDPRRVAILLLGGDKTGEWDSWYETAIPKADDLYDEHLTEIEQP